MNTNQQQKHDYDIFMEKGCEIPMGICMRTGFISEKDFAIKTTSFLRKVFSEYKGSKVVLNSSGILTGTMYLALSVNTGEPTARKALSVTNAETNKGSDWAEKLSNINQTLNGSIKPFVLTDYAKAIISKLLTKDCFTGNNKVNWNKVLQYRDGGAIQNYYSGGNGKEVILAVNNIDLSKLLERMHGRTISVEYDTKNPEHRVSYQVKLAQVKAPTVVQYTYNPIMGMLPESNQEMILQVMQYDDDVMNEICNTMGVYPKTSDIVMY